MQRLRGPELSLIQEVLRQALRETEGAGQALSLALIVFVLKNGSIQASLFVLDFLVVNRSIERSLPAPLIRRYRLDIPRRDPRLVRAFRPPVFVLINGLVLRDAPEVKPVCGAAFSSVCMRDSAVR